MGSRLSLTKIDYLKHSPFYLVLRPEEMKSFSRFFSIKNYKDGAIVFRSNDFSKHFYIIADGEIDIMIDKVVLDLEEMKSKLVGDDTSPVFRDLIDPKEQKGLMTPTYSAQEKDSSILISRKGKGDFFGVDAIKNEKNKTRTYTVRAHGPITLLCLSIDDWNKLVKQFPSIERVLAIRIEQSLNKIDFLRDVTLRNLNPLASLFRYYPLSEGSILFKEGEFGNSMFFVYEGKLEAISSLSTPISKKFQAENSDETTNTQHLPEVVLATFCTGDYFGEIALCLGVPRAATVRARTQTLLLELSKENLVRILRMVPSAKDTVNAALRKRVAANFRKYRVPFFSAISEEGYGELATLFKVEDHPQNTRIFDQGDLGDKFYIISYGEIEVFFYRNGKVFYY